MANDAQIVSAKENLKLVGPVKDKHQASTNGWALYVRAAIESKVWPTVGAIKEDTRGSKYSVCF